MASSLDRIPAIHWRDPNNPSVPLCHPVRGFNFQYTDVLDAVTCKRCIFRTYFQELLLQQKVDRYAADND